MIWRSFYSNEMVKCSWSDSPSSSGDVVHVFMSSCIFRIADIIGYIEVFCIFSVVDCDLLQLQQRLLLPYLWETTDAWSLRQLQLASAFGVRLPSVFRVDWLDSLHIRWAVGGDCSRPQSVELRQAASSQIVHLNIKSFHLYYLFTNK